VRSEWQFWQDRSRIPVTSEVASAPAINGALDRAALTGSIRMDE
jgi:hypothetical protein